MPGFGQSVQLTIQVLRRSLASLGLPPELAGQTTISVQVRAIHRCRYVGCQVAVNRNPVRRKRPSEPRSSFKRRPSSARSRLILSPELRHHILFVGRN